MAEPASEREPAAQLAPDRAGVLTEVAVEQLVEVPLVLRRTDELGLQRPHPAAQLACLGLASLGQVACGPQVEAELVVRLLARTDEGPQPLDLGPQRGHLVVGRAREGRVL